MSEYAVVAGLIQFDPDAREANGQPVRDAKVRAIGSQKIVRVTIWPEFGHVPLRKGDYVAAEGKMRVTTRIADDGTSREYIDLDARSLVHVPQQQRKPVAELVSVIDFDESPF